METATKKKILFVITKANWGGAGRYVYDLATNLSREQFEIAVVLGGTGALQEKLEKAGITVISLSDVQRDLSFSADTSGFMQLYHAIKTFKPDIVHLNSSKAGGLGAVAARLCGVPRIIFTAHGWPFGEKRNFLWRLFAFIGSWITALLSHRVICVSEYDAKNARRMPFVAHKVVRIYNGIDLHMKLGSGDIIRNAFPRDTRIIGTIGELTRNKNQMSLIEEARGNPAMFVAIVGKGELRPWLEEIIAEYGLEERVKLFGFIPASEVLRGFDVFALPSLKEGLPYVVLEAKAAGLPIIANRVGGVGEILDATDMNLFSLEQMVQKTTDVYVSP